MLVVIILQLLLQGNSEMTFYYVIMSVVVFERFRIMTDICDRQSLGRHILACLTNVLLRDFTSLK